MKKSALQISIWYHKKLKKRIRDLEDHNQNLKEKNNTLRKENLQLKETMLNMKKIDEKDITLKSNLALLRIFASLGPESFEIYNVLQKYKTINLRKLSMQIGISSQVALNLIVRLMEHDLVGLQNNLVDVNNPVVSLLW